MHAMKLYGECKYHSTHSYPQHKMEAIGQPHASAVCSLRKCPHYLLNGGFVSPGVGLDTLGKKNTSCSSMELNFNSLVVQPTATSLYWPDHGVWTQMCWFWIMFPVSHILLVSIFSSLLSCFLYKVKCIKNSEQGVLSALFQGTSVSRAITSHCQTYIALSPHGNLQIHSPQKWQP